MKSEYPKIEIKNFIDLMRAKRLLSGHKEELPTQTTERAIVWQVGVIKKLKRAIKKYES